MQYWVKKIQGLNNQSLWKHYIRTNIEELSRFISNKQGVPIEMSVQRRLKDIEKFYIS